MDEQTALLSVSAVTAAYGGRAAVSDITFMVNRGEILSIVGPNGAGKSTMVKAICNRVPLAAGSITILGQPVHKPVARINLGIAPQRAALYGKLTAYENLVCRGRQMGLDRRAAMEAADETLEIVDGREFASVRAEHMSGGMQARINVAAAVVHRPALIILDEPAANLDPDSVKDVNALMRRLAAQDYGIVLVSHDMRQVESVSTRVLLLDRGSVAASGTPADLRHRVFADQMTATIEVTGDRSDQLLPRAGLTQADTPGIWSAQVADMDALTDLFHELRRSRVDFFLVDAQRPSFSRVYDALLNAARQRLAA